MESAETVEAEDDNKTTANVLQRSCSALTVDDVYEIAKLIGSEVEQLIDNFGKESVAGLVPKTVKVLELLERFASRNQAWRLKEEELKKEELLKAFETLQLQQHKKRAAKDTEVGKHINELRVSCMVAL